MNNKRKMKKKKRYCPVTHHHVGWRRKSLDPVLRDLAKTCCQKASSGD
jgi:hypothetical protein